MADIKQENNEHWIDIIKTVLLYVIPIVAAFWKLTDTWANIQKQRLSESLKDAVRDVVNPQLEQINMKIDEMKRVQQNEKNELNKKIEDQSKEFNKQIIDVIKEINK